MTTRSQFVAEVRSWVGTPYVRCGQVKGAGCDCATVLLCSLKACGLIPGEENFELFGDDWFQHTTAEHYMYRLIRHAKKLTEMVAYRTAEVEPGNVLLLRAAGSKVYNHAGIVTEYPRLVHAIHPCVEEVDLTRHPMWSFQSVAVFDPFARKEAAC